MSEIGQTVSRRAAYHRPSVGGSRVELLLYGLNETGEPVLAERIGTEHRAHIGRLAAERLANHHAIEVWEGPTCILRLRRSGASSAGQA